MVRKKEQYVSEDVRKERRKRRLLRLCTTLFVVSLGFFLSAIWGPEDLSSKFVGTGVVFLVASVVFGLASLD
jgi:hypothetical protein